MGVKLVGIGGLTSLETMAYDCTIQYALYSLLLTVAITEPRDPVYKKQVAAFYLVGIFKKMVQIYNPL